MPMGELMQFATRIKDMNDNPPSNSSVRRLTMQQAADRAMEIATPFVAGQSHNGWRYELGPAVPHPIDPQPHGKMPRCWIVGVKWYPESAPAGSTFDGGDFVLVNLETGEAKWSR